MDCLFEGIEDETRMGRSADPPTHDAAGTGVDDEGDIDKPYPGGDISEVADPQHVRCRNAEPAVHLVQRTRCLLVRDRRPVRLSTDNPSNTHALHQPYHGAPRDIEALSDKLSPDLPDTVDPPVLLKHAKDLRAQHFVLTSPSRRPGRVGPLRQMIIVGGRSDRQHIPDRLDPVRISIRVDETHHHFDRRSSSAIAKYALGLQNLVEVPLDL